MKSPIKQCNGLEAFLDGRMEGEARHRFEHHLNGCDDCQEAAETWQTVKREYACWVERVTRDGEDNRRKMEARGFVASLLESMEDEGETPRVQKRERRIIYRVAAAAAILFGLSLTIYFMTDKGQPESTPPKAATPPSKQLAIPAIIITDSVKKSVFFKGGLENLIEAPGNGRVLGTVGQDRFGLDRFGKTRIEDLTPEQTTIRLIHGRAAFEVSPRPPGSCFTVEAGEVTIEVIGTRFSVAMDNNLNVTVCVEEGNVSVLAKDWRINLEAGSSITVEGGVALPVKAASEHEVEALTELLSDNIASASDNETVIQLPSTDIPPIRKPKEIEDREKSASPQKNLDAWRDLIIGGEVEAAEDQIRAFLRVFPADVDSLMLLANCQKRQRRYKDAVETYKRIIASGDERFANRVRYLAAELSYSGLRDLHGAVALFDDYLQHTPPNTPNRADARLMQAEALLGMGANVRAKHVLQEIVADYGRTPIANRARGLLDQLSDEAKTQK
jgi:TolA-binding protein